MQGYPANLGVARFFLAITILLESSKERFLAARNDLLRLTYERERIIINSLLSEILFFMPFPRSFSWPRFSGRALARLWALGALLPMLLLSIAGNVPHDHELRALSTLVRSASSVHHQEAHVVAPSVQPNAQTRVQSSVMAPSLVAHSVETLCLLCQWASVAGALLLVALALSWFAMRVEVGAFVRSFVFGCASLALRSRAPPV